MRKEMKLWHQQIHQIENQLLKLQDTINKKKEEKESDDIEAKAI